MNHYIFIWLLGASITHVLLYRFSECIRDELEHPLLASGLVSLFAWPAVLPVLLMLM